MTGYKIILVFVTAVITSCEKEVTVRENLPTSKVTDILLYSNNANGHNEVYKLENGIETLVLSNAQYDYWWPKVNHDKTKLLVYRSPVNPSKDHDDYENAELLLSDVDGTDQKVIIESSKFGWKSQGVCRWNMNGTKILMCAEVEINGSFQWRIVSTDINGENPRVLSNYWAIDCNYAADDTYIYFMGFADNVLTPELDKLELQRGQYDSTLDTLINIESLTANSTRDHDPAVSPDNAKIVFSAGNASYSDVDLVLFDIETETESILVNDDSANGGSICWSKDGKHVYYHSVEILKSPFRIKRVNIDTGEKELLLQASDNSHGYFHPEAY